MLNYFRGHVQIRGNPVCLDERVDIEIRLPITSGYWQFNSRYGRKNSHL